VIAPCRRQAPTLLAARHTNRGTLFGVSSLLGAVPLETPANDVDVPQVKWVNVANEGEYLGHHQGGFELTREVMAQLIANLRASPKYKLGPVTLPDGSTIQAGSDDVVQYDYEHASEMAPWEGSIPQTGAPAIGWVWDLEVRQDASGRAQLWALSWLGDQIRGQIARREYKWVSIAWNPNGVHWQSGEPIGAVLTSIAFTNHPFLQDLADLAARAGVGAAGQARRSRLPSRQPSAVEAYAARAHSNPNRGKSPMGSEQASNIRARLCSLYKLQPEANDDSIIRAAENASTNGGTLAAVLAAFGVADPQALMDASKELPNVRQKLADALAELDSLGRADASADEAVAQQDVGAALSATGWAKGGLVDPRLVFSLTSGRQAMIDGEIAKLPEGKRTVGEKRLARDRGRQAFLAAYGVNQNPATQHLTQTFVAGPNANGTPQQFPAPLPGVQFSQPGGFVQLAPVGGQPLPGNPGQPQRQPLQLSQPNGAGVQLEAIDFQALTGRNVTEKFMSYLSGRDPNFSKLEHGSKVQRASEYRRSYEAQFGPVNVAA
jgi:hypothetical protein